MMGWIGGCSGAADVWCERKDGMEGRTERHERRAARGGRARQKVRGGIGLGEGVEVWLELDARFLRAIR